MMAVKVPTLESVDAEYAQKSKRRAQLMDKKDRLHEKMEQLRKEGKDQDPGATWSMVYTDGHDIHPDEAGMTKVMSGSPSEAQRVAWESQDIDREIREITEAMPALKHRAGQAAATKVTADYRSEVLKLAQHLCDIFEPVAVHHTLRKSMEREGIPPLTPWPSDAFGLGPVVQWLADAVKADLLDSKDLTPAIKRQVLATVANTGWRAHWGE